MEKDTDGKDDPVTTLSAVVSGGRIKCQWQVKYTTDEDDADGQKELAEKGYTLPEYALVVECGGATSGESGVLEVRGWIQVKYVDKSGNPLANKNYVVYLLDEKTCISGTTDENGFVQEDELKQGRYFIIFEE